MRINMAKKSLLDVLIAGKIFSLVMFLLCDYVPYPCVNQGSDAKEDFV